MIWYVRETAVGTGDCTSWANACLLRQAIPLATYGDQIWVAAGTYKPSYSPSHIEHRNAGFTLTKGVAIYGGFPAAGGTFSQRDWETNITILSGEVRESTTITDNILHVVYSNGVTETAILDGFIITGGYGSGAGFTRDAGGGMHNENSSPTLANLIFINNHAMANGGGMWNLNSSPHLQNVVFVGNSTTQSGGGMYNEASNPTLVNVTFVANAAGFGGGLYANNTSYPNLTNCIVWSNVVTYSDAQIRSSTLNNTTVNYSIVQGGWAGGGGTGNLTSDPLFVRNPTLGANPWMGLSDYGDLHLQGASPAIDAGQNSPVLDGTDMDGDLNRTEAAPFDLNHGLRFMNIPTKSDTGSGTAPLVDMGAYEVVNHAPDLTAITTPRSVNEGSQIAFTIAATDSDIPANTLTFSLPNTPANASLNASTGAFSWTPSETQGPGTYDLNFIVSDGVLTDSQVVRINVGEVNIAPVLNSINTPQTINEESQIAFTATATDDDRPNNTLTFSLGIGAPIGAQITSGGAFTWTPTEEQGNNNDYTIRVIVGDGTTTVFQDVVIHVNEINTAPELGNITTPQTVAEGSQIAFNATAADVDRPNNTLTFSLTNAPNGAAITPGGAFTWTPGETQGPGSYTVRVNVSDGTTSDYQDVVINVSEVNLAPKLAAITTPWNIPEGSPMTFTATATDDDRPANTLAFSLKNAPNGAAINPTSGIFTWNPDETQGPGSYSFSVVVTDSGSPAASAEQVVQVNVAEANQAPLANSDLYTTPEDTRLSVAVADGVLHNDSDSDLPPATLTARPYAAPTHGALALALDGSFVYTPTLNYHGLDSFTYVVSDGVLTDTAQVTITVSSVDDVPLVAAGADISSAVEGLAVSFQGSYQEILRPSSAQDSAAAVGIRWDFGDNAGATGVLTPTHTYVDDGKYTVTLTVTSTNGLAAKDTLVVTVSNAAPLVNAGPDGKTTINRAHIFKASFTDSGAVDTHTIAWDFGDNTTASGSLTPRHAYTTAGDYTVKLTITDNGGAATSDTLVVHVTPPLPAYLPVTMKVAPLVFVTEADSYVSGSKPTSNYGNATSLRVDAAPVMRSYIQFNVQGIKGTVTSVRLFLYADANAKAGTTVSSTGSDWREMGINYNNAPAAVSKLATLDALSEGTWVEIDLTGYVTENGVYSLMLDTSEAASFSSREGANAPRLEIKIQP